MFLLVWVDSLHIHGDYIAMFGKKHTNKIFQNEKHFIDWMNRFYPQYDYLGFRQTALKHVIYVFEENGSKYYSYLEKVEIVDAIV